MDSTNRFRLAPEGKIVIEPVGFYTYLVSALGIDDGTEAYNSLLSLGTQIRNYSFYQIVLLNVHLVVELSNTLAVDDAAGIDEYVKICFFMRRTVLLEGLNAIITTLSLKTEFKRVIDFIGKYSSLIGLDISIHL